MITGKPAPVTAMNDLKKLLALLKKTDLKRNRLYIQTHDFPDQDAVASAFGLQKLLEHYGYRPELIYAGELQRESLSDMVRSLGIKLHKASARATAPGDFIMIVDGCKGSKNVTELPGTELAVIDHHASAAAKNTPFRDVRRNYGACSTIIYEYYRGAGVKVPRRVATALLLGINIDTALLTRRVSPHDMEACYLLHKRADNRLAGRLLRNNTELGDLVHFKAALAGLVVKGSYAFCYLPGGCGQNLLAILGDFFLSLKEVHFAVVCAHNGNRINVSVRSENVEWHAAEILKAALAGRGLGGGHPDMAGGLIHDPSSFREDAFRSKIAAILKL